ncbi:MAG: DNA polymerase III subunit alpha, partial [Pseudomonadota bacterium]
DYDHLFGVMEFAAAAAAKGIQPLIGCDLAVTICDETISKGDPCPGRLLAFAANETGYLNLLALVSAQGSPDAEPQREHGIDLTLLKRHNAGLLVLDSGWMGPAGQALLAGKRVRAEHLTRSLAGLFDGRYYIEIMRTGREQEQVVEGGLLQIALDQSIPIIASNDCHYPEHEFHEAHEVLTCINANTVLDDPARKADTGEHYFKSADAMVQRFADLPEAISNSLVIAKRLAYMPAQRDPILPRLQFDAGQTAGSCLAEKARAGLQKRLGAQTSQARKQSDYDDRLTYELEMIDQMGFSDYFLIVADFIEWARRQAIPVGPGRGSGAGSLVAWSLTITDIDPLAFGLLFERFLNPERISMPDFDIDFCQDQRDRVIEYVQQKYGNDRVAQIITFGKLQARAVLRDVGRVLGLPWGQVDRICRLVPNHPSNPLTLDQAIGQDQALQDQIKAEPEHQKLFEIARKLEGLYRHASTHAAGVVIADRPLHQLIPLYRDPRSTIPATGFNMKWVEKAGLVKFDFLGLKTLSILTKIEQMINARDGQGDFSFARIPLDDPATFACMQAANTIGVFQLESSGMRDVLRQLKPDRFDDIIALVALYRPGPMDNIASFIKCKHGQEKPSYLHPLLEDILAPTYGIAVYQEQVIEMARALAGFSLGSADLLRNAMGKKIKAQMQRQRVLFVKGAAHHHGIKANLANRIFDQMNAFAGYGFNKSHAVCYALIAYQTAWAKANYPAEFYAASLCFELNNTDRITSFIQDMPRNNVSWSAPDINQSQADFSVQIRAETASVHYGLAAIRNIGRQAMEACVKVRTQTGPFKDVFDFVERVQAGDLNRRSFENLVRAGCFDKINPNRGQLFASSQQLLDYGQDVQNDRLTGQTSLFGEGGDVQARPHLPTLDDWTIQRKMEGEFEACGLYLSDHPMSAYQTMLADYKLTHAADLQQGREGRLTMAGVVIGKRIRQTRRGSMMVVQISDITGIFEVMLFDQILIRARPLLDAQEPLLLRLDCSWLEGREAPRLSVLQVESLETKRIDPSRGLQIVVASAEPIRIIHKLLAAHGDEGT